MDKNALRAQIADLQTALSLQREINFGLERERDELLLKVDDLPSQLRREEDSPRLFAQERPRPFGE